MFGFCGLTFLLAFRLGETPSVTFALTLTGEAGLDGGGCDVLSTLGPRGSAVLLKTWLIAFRSRGASEGFVGDGHRVGIAGLGAMGRRGRAIGSVVMFDRDPMLGVGRLALRGDGSRAGNRLEEATG